MPVSRRGKVRTARWARTLLILLSIFAGRTQAQIPLRLTVQTSTLSDTIPLGRINSLYFVLDSATATEIATLTVPLRLTFSSGNIIGPLSDSGALANVGWVPWSDGPDSSVLTDFGATTDPDTVLFRRVDLTPPYGSGAGEQWRLTFTPLDTGTITLDTILRWPDAVLTATDANGQPYPVVFDSRTITVAPFCPSGDLNGDGKLNGLDFYILVDFVLYGGPPPTVCLAHADVNCDGSVGAGDIICLKHYIYVGDFPVCYTCGMVADGIWTCP